MNLCEEKLQKLEVLVDILFEGREYYEVKDYLIDKILNKSVELQELLDDIFEDSEQVDLEQIESLNASYFAKQVLKRYFCKNNFEDLDNNSSFKNYRDEIKNFSVLSKEEEQQLFIEYQNSKSKKIFNKIFESYLNFVVDVAKKVLRNEKNINESDFMDLIQEGNIGLMHAIEKFDVNKNYRFTAYAYYWIRKYIIEKKGNLIKLPIRLEYMLNKIQKMDNQNDEEDLATNLNISVDNLRKYRNLKKPWISLNTMIDSNSDDEFELQEVISDNSLSIEELLEKKEMKELVFEMLSELDEKSREVMLYRFGFKDGVLKTLKEVGEEIGLSKERVRQIEVKALKKLREGITVDKVKNYVGGKYI